MKAFLAVQDFNLEIKDKEFIVLVGPSGCGKSTTLRMVAGLEEISGGELYIDGNLVNDVASKDRDIAMVFQSYALYPHMTVWGKHGLPAQAAQDAQGGDRAARQPGGRDPRHHPVSGPQAQGAVRRPAPARRHRPRHRARAQGAAHGRAALQSGRQTRNQMRAEIIKLRHRINTTFIYVTHDQTEAMTLGDRIVIMRDGVIQQVGTPQEVFNHPANQFVAGFIGMPQMNFYDAQLVKDSDGKYAVELEKAPVVLSEDKQANLARNNVQPGPVTLGVRPEHLVLTGDADKMITGKVEVSEMMGSAVHLHISACGSDTIIIVPTTELESASAFSIGSPISFTFSGSTAHLFDPETQKSLEA